MSLHVCQLCPMSFHAETSRFLLETQAQSRRVISRLATALESPENFRLFAGYEDSAVVGTACYDVSKSYLCLAGRVTMAAAQSLLSSLVEELGTFFSGLHGCDGPPEAVDSIAAVCQELFGCCAYTTDRLETMILDTEPQLAVGIQGVLKPIDSRSKLLPVLALWFEQFEKDTDNVSYSLEGRQKVISHLSEAASRQDLFTWEVKDKPVAMAILGRTQPKQLLCVYTPPHQRGRGYGQAVTAATCAERRRVTKGKEPISLSAVHKFGAARVYERVGFRSVGWIHGVSFETCRGDTEASRAVASFPGTEADSCRKSDSCPSDTDVDTDVETDALTCGSTDVETDVEADDELYAEADVETDLGTGLDGDCWDLDLETDPAKLFASSGILLACT